MNERLRSIMVAHGALVFLTGLAAGFPFAFFIMQKVALWPIPGFIDWTPPGDYRAWRMAHLEGILNGLTLIGVAAVGGQLKLTDRAQALICWGLIITSWGNISASVIGPIFGGRGLEFGGGGFSNSLMYLLFVLAIITVVTAMILIFKGAMANLKVLKEKGE